MKQKILLAINELKIEEALIKYLNEQFEFVGKPVTYKEAILPRIEIDRPDILVVREKLKGTISFDGLIHDIRTQHPNVRIVIIAGQREIGDPFFKEMVHYGVYDICYGSPLNLLTIIKMIMEPNTLDYGLQLCGENRTYDSSTENAVSDSQLVEDLSSPPSKKKLSFFGDKKKKAENPPVKHAEKSESPMATPVVPVKTPVTEPNIPKQTIPKVQPTPSEEPKVLAEKKPVVLGNAMGTQVLGVEEETSQGFVFLPYVMQPVSVKNFASSESYYVDPDGNVLDAKLPIRSGVKPLANRNFDDYVMSLTRSRNNLSFSPPKLAKITVFSSVRQGTGCSTVALNTACALASKGQKVLFLDICMGRSSCYSRLEMPLTLDGIDDALNYLKNGESIVDLPLTHERLMSYATEESKSRFADFPDTLAFMKYSENFNSMNDTHVAMIPEFVKILGQMYDHIIIDSSLLFLDTYLYKWLEVCDKFILVTVQDIYELNLALDSLKQFTENVDLFAKLMVVVNRYYSLAPGIPEIMEHFGIKMVIPVPSDERGFIKSYASGYPYYLYHGKRKVVLAYEDIVAVL